MPGPLPVGAASAATTASPQATAVRRSAATIDRPSRRSGFSRDHRKHRASATRRSGGKPRRNAPGAHRSPAPRPRWTHSGARRGRRARRSRLKPLLRKAHLRRADAGRMPRLAGTPIVTPADAHPHPVTPARTEHRPPPVTSAPAEHAPPPRHIRTRRARPAPRHIRTRRTPPHHPCTRRTRTAPHPAHAGSSPRRSGFSRDRPARRVPPHSTRSAPLSSLRNSSATAGRARRTTSCLPRLASRRASSCSMATPA